MDFQCLYIRAKLNKYNFYVMEKLGNSLKWMRKILIRYTLENVLFIAIQMVNRLELIHSLNYVHRDIKPANVLFGIHSKLDILNIIDFGLIKKVSKFKNSELPSQIFDRNFICLSGTPNFASINLHWGWEEWFKKDDIEGLLYMLIHMLRGNLNIHYIQIFYFIQKFFYKINQIWSI
jgi:serine/threonine protein kinase